MKNLIVFLLFLAVVGFVLVYIPNPLTTFAKNAVIYSACDKPIHYHIDSVDPRFNLSRPQFLTDVEKATQIWDAAEGKQLFVYDPKGELGIGMIYDERQSLNSKITDLESQLANGKSTISPKIQEYEQMSADFKQKLADLNSRIEYWNKQGGAPPDVYQQLIDEQKKLQAEADTLNTMARQLNRSEDQYNTQVGKLDATIDQYNVALQTRPEEGIYDPQTDRIEIYFNVSQTELVHTLAHELGHAIGLGHSDSKDDIMYPKTTQNVTPSTNDLKALTEICKKHNVLELVWNRFQQLLPQPPAQNNANGGQ